MPTPPSPSDEAPLEEGVDYYVEGDTVVFTAHYLEKRGWCCRNGCRHCPYGFGGGKGAGRPTPPEDPRQGRLF